MRVARVIDRHEHLYACREVCRKMGPAAWRGCSFPRAASLVIPVRFPVLVLDLHGDVAVARTELPQQGIE